MARLTRKNAAEILSQLKKDELKGIINTDGSEWWANHENARNSYSQL